MLCEVESEHSQFESIISSFSTNRLGHSMFNSKLALAAWASVNVHSTISNVKHERRLKGISHKRLALEVQKWSGCDISAQSSFYVSAQMNTFTRPF